MDAAKGPTRADAMRRINLLWSVVLKSPTVSYGSMKTVAEWHNCILSQLYSIESQRYRLLLLKEKNYNMVVATSISWNPKYLFMTRRDYKKADGLSVCLCLISFHFLFLNTPRPLAFCTNVTLPNQVGCTI